METNVDNNLRMEDNSIFDEITDSESQDSKLESPTLYVDHLSEFYDSFEFCDKFYVTNASDTSKYEEFLDCKENIEDLESHNLCNLETLGTLCQFLLQYRVVFCPIHVSSFQSLIHSLPFGQLFFSR